MKNVNLKTKFYMIFVIVTLIFIPKTILINNLFNNDSGIVLSPKERILRSSAETIWNPNGTAICTADSTQYAPQICSDGFGGAIIAWNDERSIIPSTGIFAQRIDSEGNMVWTENGTLITDSGWYPHIVSDGFGGAIIVYHNAGNDESYDISAQRIGFNGNLLWKTNGITVCNASGGQVQLDVCSDGLGGALTVWMENRSGISLDIYAQRINSDGITLWDANGTLVCDDVADQERPRICNDGSGGAIISWQDERNGVSPWFYSDIFAQRINSTGSTQWLANGTEICIANDRQVYPRICSDGLGGAFIAWGDKRSVTMFNLYAQRIDTNGIVQWSVDGNPVCTEDIEFTSFKLDRNENGGVIIAWTDLRVSDYQIYAQLINNTGNIEWASNGIIICSAPNDQYGPMLCSDNAGGAIITWVDHRFNVLGGKIFVQRVNVNGINQWIDNGIALSTEIGEQYRPQICSDGLGGAIIVWEDHRDGWLNRDIYAQRIENPIPFSDYPLDLITSLGRSDTINWTLEDDSEGGSYRVLANSTIGNTYIWVNWTSWFSGVELNVQINQSALGDFNYTIEYRDDQYRYGVLDSVIVSIVQNNPPTSNHPSNIMTSTSGAHTIDWTLFDDFGGGQFRVLANNSIGNFYVWEDWQPWTPNTPFSVLINRTKAGSYNYTIEYFDDQGEYGVPDTVLVNTIIQPSFPTEIMIISIIAVSGGILAIAVFLWIRRKRKSSVT